MRDAGRVSAFTFTRRWPRGHPGRECMLGLDSGPGTGRGDFRCTVPTCGWAKQGVTRDAAEKHMKRRHPGEAPGIARTPEAEEARKRLNDRVRTISPTTFPRLISMTWDKPNVEKLRFVRMPVESCSQMPETTTKAGRGFPYIMSST